jgi:hypothetical protein
VASFFCWNQEGGDTKKINVEEKKLNSVIIIGVFKTLQKERMR